MSVSEEVHELAKRYLKKVKKSGPDNILALCPFHDNRDTPSFTMSLSRGIYFCFSCNEAGTLTQFLKNFGLTWNVIERNYRGLIDETRKNGTKKNNDPFVFAPVRRILHSLNTYWGCSILFFQTSGLLKKDLILSY